MDSLSQRGHHDFEQSNGRNPPYSMIVNGSKECIVSVAAGSQNYVFHSEDETAKCVW